MEFCKDWPSIQERYRAYWARENHDRPLLHISAPKDNRQPPPPSRHATLKERWMDTEYQLVYGNWMLRNTYYAGEAIPTLCPNLGPDFFAACYGTEMDFGEDTSWALPHLTDEDVEAHAGFRLDNQNAYYLKMLEMTRAMAEDGRDRYLVGVTDLHPGGDGLVSMRSPEALCYDTIDAPQFVRQGALDLLPGFQSLYGELQGIIEAHQQGSINWMGIWHPGRWYVTSCDFCCMVSPDTFNKLLLDELRLELDFLDASIFHLDGPGALKHLDTLLSLEKLKGIQWVYGAGQPTAPHWIDVLLKIQRAGKLICVEVPAKDLPWMLENLPPEGVLYQVSGVESESHARSLMALAEKRR